MLFLQTLGVAATLASCPVTLPSSSAITSTPVALVDSSATSPTFQQDSTPSRSSRPKAIEYSDWYARRLKIHKIASYTTIPLFAIQYITGEQLLKQGRTASPARYIHGPAATAIAGLFAINTVTGMWNLKDSWPDPEGRTSRTLHSTLMLLGDAGFVATGLIAGAAENSSQKRQQHKRIALISMGISLTGYVIMLPPFRRD